MIRKRFLQNAQKLTGLTNDVPAYPALEPAVAIGFKKVNANHVPYTNPEITS
jgi:hypothetical protein